jgi:predicted small secreted protein
MGKFRLKRSTIAVIIVVAVSIIVQACSGHR